MNWNSNSGTFLSHSSSYLYVHTYSPENYGHTGGSRGCTCPWRSASYSHVHSEWFATSFWLAFWWPYLDPESISLLVLSLYSLISSSTSPRRISYFSQAGSYCFPILKWFWVSWSLNHSSYLNVLSLWWTNCSDCVCQKFMFSGFLSLFDPNWDSKSSFMNCFHFPSDALLSVIVMKSTWPILAWTLSSHCHPSSQGLKSLLFDSDHYSMKFQQYCCLSSRSHCDLQ